MTIVETPANANLPAVPAGSAIPGLGDLDKGDLSIPRLKILHREALFEDSLSKETFTELDVIVLGLMKGRILWDTAMEDDAVPFCKSYDTECGHADPAEFPWDASGFDAADYDAEAPVLPCAGCALKDWGSHPDPNREAPWCNLQHIHPVLMRDGAGEFTMPAILTVQKTGIKPSQDYSSSYQRARLPMFSSTTHLSLNALKKAGNPYCVPIFRKGVETDQDMWGEWTDLWYDIERIVKTPRDRVTETAVSNPSAPAASAPAASTAASPPAKAQPDGAGAAQPDEEEIPF